MSGTSHRKLCWKEPTAWAKSILVSQTAEAIDPRMRLAIRPMRTKDWTFPNATTPCRHRIDECSASYMWSQAYVNRSGVGPVGAHSRAPESLHSRAPEGPARDVALSPGDSATLLDQAVSKPTTLRSGPEWLGAPESGRASAATTLRLCDRPVVGHAYLFLPSALYD